MPYHKKTHKRSHKNKARHSKTRRTKVHHKKRNYRGGDEEKGIGHHIQAIGSKISSSFTNLFKEDEEDKKAQPRPQLQTVTPVQRQSETTQVSPQSTISGGKRRYRKKSKKHYKKTHSRRRR